MLTYTAALPTHTLLATEFSYSAMALIGNLTNTATPNYFLDF
jgi:hypothetical protein